MRCVRYVTGIQAQLSQVGTFFHAVFFAPSFFLSLSSSLFFSPSFFLVLAHNFSQLKCGALWLDGNKRCGIKLDWIVSCQTLLFSSRFSALYLFCSQQTKEENCRNRNVHIEMQAFNLFVTSFPFSILEFTTQKPTSSVPPFHWTRARVSVGFFSSLFAFSCILWHQNAMQRTNILTRRTTNAWFHTFTASRAHTYFVMFGLFAKNVRQRARWCADYSECVNWVSLNNNWCLVVQQWSRARGFDPFT